jgi:hypothetical protein
VAGAAVLLITLYAVGAASAYRHRSGDAVPYELAAFLLPLILAPVLTALYGRVRMPATPPVITRSDVVRFAVFPFEPLLTGIAAIRWQQGDSAPVEPMPPTARPIVVMDHDRLEIWADPDDGRPMLSIPVGSLASIRSGVLMVQLSRIPVKDRVRAILVDVTVRREVIELPLPICDAANATRMAPPRAIDSTVASMRSIADGSR